MSHKPAYCPFCGNELEVHSYEPYSENIFWKKCRVPRCKLKNIEIKTDPEGFVLEPVSLRFHYVYAKPEKYQ